MDQDFEASAQVINDTTRVALQGVNISGGQKQRVAIARATYANADVYLFDDPLSALDAGVGRKVFKQCIQGELRGRTRLLVTNQLQYVAEADKVVVLKGGKIAEAGTYAALMAQKGSLLGAMMHDVVIEEDDNSTQSMIAILATRLWCRREKHIFVCESFPKTHLY